MRTEHVHHPDTEAPKTVSYFVTSFLHEEAAADLVRWGERLPCQVTGNPITRIHITWRSFDGLPPGRFADLKAALREVAARHAPFRIRVRGGGCFQAGAVWVRIVSPEALALQADVDEALTRLGCPPASHPFVPHVTLGHGPAGTEAPAWLSDLELETELDALWLTTTGHAEYRVALRLPLGPPSDEDLPGSP